MKNMLFLAGSTTLVVASFLLWMDRAVARRFDQHPVEPAARLSTHTAIQTNLPVVTIRPTPQKPATGSLSKKVQKPWQCSGACSNRIP